MEEGGQYYADDNEDESERSELEARLYAEIYYSNSILGDTSDKNNTETVEQPSTDARVHQSHATDIHTSKTFDSNTNQSTTTVNNETLSNKRVHDKCAENNTSSNVQTSHSSKTSENISQKRTLIESNNLMSNKHNYTNNTSCEEINRFNKKRRNENVQQEDDVQNSINDNSRSLPQAKKSAKTDSNKNGRIINPFNKNNSQLNNVTPLSTAFYSLFQQANVNPKNKKKKKKKLENRLSQKDQSKKSKTNTNEKYISNEEPEIIAISSEDSADESQEVTSKFDAVETTEKISKKNSLDKSISLDNSTSDSEESIFEVPVPPKPAPPLINLNDSDNENKSKESENEDDSFLNDSVVSQTSLPINDCDEETENMEIRSLNTTRDTISESEDTNFIFNCTEIQKGASSIEEIKNMSNSSSGSKEQVQEVSSSAQNVDVNQENWSDKQVTSSRTNEKSASTSRKKKRSRVSTRRKNLSMEEYFFQPMTESMKSFYNDSWGGENFDLEKLKSQMSSDSKKWAILRDDSFPVARRNKRYFGMVCNRCNKEGHKPYQCTEVAKTPTCHMCGKIGHYENRCPDKMCLTCGQHTSMYRKTCDKCSRMICSRCNSQGHIESSCPDLWRRYHHTVNKNNPDIPQNLRKVTKPSHELYCCNCAKRGHDFSYCQKLRWSQHFAVPHYVTSYHGPAYLPEDGESRIVSNPPENLNVRSTYENVRDDLFNVRVSNENFGNFLERPSTYNPSMKQSPQNESNSTVIFDIKSKKSDNGIGLEEFKIVLHKTVKNSASVYKSWENLMNFFHACVSEHPGRFKLLLKNQQLTMEIIFLRNSKNSIVKLIEQYRDRNTYERSLMYYTVERDSKKILDHIDYQIKQMSDLTADPVNLYEKVMQIYSKHKTPQNDLIITRENAAELNRLANLQKMLLMRLYLENYADNSFTSLQSLLKRIRKKYNTFTNFRVSKKKKALIKEHSVKIRALFQILFLYNNIFVPYNPKQLPLFISKCGKNLEMVNKFQNNPSLLSLAKQTTATSTNFPKNQSENTDYSADELPMFNSNSQFFIDNRNEPHTSGIIIKDFRALPNHLDTASQNNNCNSTKITTPPKQKNKKYPRDKSNWQKRQKIIAEAKKLNIPHVQKFINTLEREQTHNLNAGYCHHLELLIKRAIKKQKKKF